MVKSLEDVQEGIKLKEDFEEKMKGEQEAGKRFVMDLAKNMGFQMHQITENQNAVLGENAAKFNEFETRISKQIRERF